MLSRMRWTSSWPIHAHGSSIISAKTYSICQYVNWRLRRYIPSLLWQNHRLYYSLISASFVAFHNYLGDRADSYLRDHNEKLCPVCQKEKASGSVKPKAKKSSEMNGTLDNSEKSDIFGKIGWVLFYFAEYACYLSLTILLTHL